MAVSVLLDLNQVVSVRDLTLFLSYIPDDSDPTADLRMGNVSDDRAHFLEIPIPVTPKSE